jgi:hypothetical protein
MIKKLRNQPYALKWEQEGGGGKQIRDQKMKQHKYHNSDEIIGVRVDAAFA